MHIGTSPTSGHYFCFVRTAPDMWYNLDDYTVIISFIYNCLKLDSPLVTSTQSNSDMNGDYLYFGMLPCLYSVPYIWGIQEPFTVQALCIVEIH